MIRRISPAHRGRRFSPRYPLRTPRYFAPATMRSFESSLAETVRTLQSLSAIRPEIDRAGEMILATLRRSGKLLICGNGGSAAEAAHFSTELVGRYAKNRRALPAIALSADGSLLTCVVNDYGYEHAFSRQVAGFARPEDLLVVLTTSGNSANILAALHEAKRMKLESIAFLGRGGGQAKGLATCDLIIPGQCGPATQDAHLFLLHHFCELIDAEFN
jgi:D-sedoheptulose 7-phosphate isomerase